MKSKTTKKTKKSTLNKISAINRNAAWEYFLERGMIHKGMVLHHKDVDMKHEDYDRYIQWNVSDLVPMTK